MSTKSDISWFFLYTLNYDARSTTHQHEHIDVFNGDMVCFFFLSQELNFKILLDLYAGVKDLALSGRISHSWLNVFGEIYVCFVIDVACKR